MLPIIVLKIGAKSNAILFLCFVALQIPSNDDD